MFSLSRRGSATRTTNIWPGFVDALATLLMVIIFVLMVFMVAQFYLSNALSGQQAELDRLNERVSELSELLSIERQENAELRGQINDLSGQLQALQSERNNLQKRVDKLTQQRNKLQSQVDKLTERAESAEARVAALSADLDEAYKTIEADKATIEKQKAELARLQNDLKALRKARKKLENRLTELSAALEASRKLAEKRKQQLAQSQQQRSQLEQELKLSEEQIAQLRKDMAQLRDKRKQLKAELAEQKEKTQLAQQKAQKRRQAVEQLRGEKAQASQALESQRKLSAQQEEQIALLNAQLTAVKARLREVQAALQDAEDRAAAQKAKIANLTERLNAALVQRVSELKTYRSEFFGRLRKVLEDRQDIRVVGDRFVFQSELLFDTASAKLGAAGRQKIAKFADTLLDIADEIPDDLDWIVRVDGHTDRRPIDTEKFPNNWALSTARARSVVQALIDEGVPPNRLAATGFAATRPLDTRNDSIARRRNRRIEFKLTEP